MQKLVIGNWKMDPADIKSAEKILKGIIKGASKAKGAEIVVCPPALFISGLIKKTRSKKVQFGAQNVAQFEKGSHTGELSAEQLANTGVKYVIVGHSERRALGETSDMVSQKIESSLKSGLKVVLCIGEEKRDENNGAHLEFLAEELTESLSRVENLPAGKAGKNLKNITIAYEPIWAIGAEEAMQPSQIHEMSIFIKKVLSEKFGPDVGRSTRIIYGGSVNSENIEDIMRNGHIDGVLPGRASRDPKEFGEIMRVVSEQ